VCSVRVIEEMTLHPWVAPDERRGYGIVGEELGIALGLPHRGGGRSGASVPFFIRFEMDTLRLPARMENIEAFRSFVAERMDLFETNRDRVLLIELGLEEFLTNVVKYAYPRGEGDVEVACSLTENGMFRMSIKDWGIPFNPLSYGDPDLTGDISQRRVGGLGIYLVRRMFDEVHYERKDDCNVIVLCCRT